jgi:signal transduction histidine kinase/GAF domain-containing protein
MAITLNAIEDFEDKLQQIVNKTSDYVRSDQVSLYEIDNEAGQMVCRYICARQDTIVPAGMVAGIPPIRNLPEYIGTLQFCEGEDVNGFMRYWNKPARAKSLLIVPIRIKQRIFGFIEIITLQKIRNWNGDDLGFVSAIGNMVANFYDRKSIDDELKLNYLKQEFLSRVSSRLNQYADDGEHALNAVFQYIGANRPDIERIYIYRYNDRENRFYKTHEYANPSLNPKYGSRKEYDGLLFSEQISRLKTGEPCCVSHLNRLIPELQLALEAIHVKSFLWAPLFVNDQLYGVYGYTVYTHHHIWKKTEIEIARSFAGIISHFIERQSFLKKIKTSEQKFKDISAKLPGCVFQATLLATEEILLNYISPQFEQWSGIKHASKSSLDILQQAAHPDDHGAFLAFRQELCGLHPEISFEGRFYFPLIGFKWLIIRITLSEWNPSGERTYNGLLIDMTEKKQAELKLAEANASIQSIINNLKVGILLVDDHENVLYCNEKLMEMLATAEVFDAKTGQQNQILNATCHLVKNGIELKARTSGLMRNRTNDRSRELYLYKSAEFITRDYIPVFRDNHFFAHLFIFNNITHNKQQELEIQKAYKRARTVIDHSDVGVLLLGENEKILLINEQFLKMYRIDGQADYFVNQPFGVIWNKVNENAALEGIDYDFIHQAVHSGTHVANREFYVDGNRVLRCFIEPLADNVPVYAEHYETLIQMIDVTTQKNIEHTLRIAKEEAEAIASAKSHILMSMSHEIRTPLNGILGFSTMLKESLADPYQKEMAEVIDQSGHRLMDTLNTILDFSVAQSEKKSFKITSVGVNKVIQDQVELYQTMALQKGLYLYAETEGQINVAVSEQVLYKILQNLINNAVKYTVHGGVEINARIVKKEDGEWLDLKVIDTGTGIDECMHKTVFEPFRQVSEGYGRAFEGTGLGLSLVKEYVQKMNGEIHLASRKNEGSTFTVLLPNAYYESNDTSTARIGLSPESPEQ